MSNGNIPTDFVPVVSQVASALVESGTTPPVTPKELDNPPRVRPIGASTLQYTTVDPFAGLAFSDVLYLRNALHTRLNELALDPQGKDDEIGSIKRLIALSNLKLSPTSTGNLVVPPVPPRPAVLVNPGPGRPS